MHVPAAHLPQEAQRTPPTEVGGNARPTPAPDAAASAEDTSPVAQLYAAIEAGELTLAEVVGLEPEHLQAMSYRAYELLRLGEARRALKLYLALYELDPYDFTHQRGAAYCFSRIRQDGFAVGYFRLAMASAGRKDLACLIGPVDALAALGDREGARVSVAEALA